MDKDTPKLNFDDRPTSGRLCNKPMMSFTSQNICHILDLEEWSKMRINRKSEILLIEASTIWSWKYSPVLTVGSHAEAFDLISSDMDKMFLSRNAIVVSSADEANHFSEDIRLLLMCPDDHRPCYPALKFLTVIDEENLRTCAELDVIQFAEHIDGVNFLSSEKFAKAFFEFSKMATLKCPTSRSYKRHGPCSVMITTRMDFDVVFSICTSKWPYQAIDWISRKRKSGWPNKDLIQKVVETRCTLVPVGNPSSDLQRIEWRLSFILCERLLIWDFNKTQFYCFVLTKDILKRFIASKFEDSVDSFLLKTTIFWMMEENLPEFWSKDNIFFCIKAILSSLKDYIKHESLPHYFVPTNNILDCKTSLKTHRLLIVNELESIIEDLLNCLHISIGFKCRRSCPICTGCIFNGLVEQNSWNSDYSSPPTHNRLVRYMTSGFIDMIEGLDEIEYVAKFLDEKPECVFEEHVDTLRKMLHTRKGIELYKLIYEEGSHEISIEDVKNSFMMGTAKDALGGWLYLGTFYYMQGMVREAIKLVESLMNGQKTRNDDNDHLRYGLIYSVPDIPTRQHSTYELENDLWNYDTVRFCRSDYTILPSPIACECLLCDEDFTSFFIPASIYAYFLKFMICLKQNNLEILPNILFQFQEKAVRFKEVHVDHRDVALNLLGFCLMKAGSYRKAMSSFYASHQERPAIKNPCLYYAILTIKKYKERKDGS